MLIKISPHFHIYTNKRYKINSLLSQSLPFQCVLFKALILSENAVYNYIKILRKPINVFN